MSEKKVQNSDGNSDSFSADSFEFSQNCLDAEKSIRQLAVHPVVLDSDRCFECHEKTNADFDDKNFLQSAQSQTVENQTAQFQTVENQTDRSQTAQTQTDQTSTNIKSTEHLQTELAQTSTKIQYPQTPAVGIYSGSKSCRNCHPDKEMQTAHNDHLMSEFRDCESCHGVHGSPEQPLLWDRRTNICQQCHELRL